MSKYKYKQRSSKYGSTIDISHEVSLVREENEVEVTYLVEVKGTFSTGYPPPPCSNHDHPDFGDPGSGPELDIESAKVTGYDNQEEVEPSIKVGSEIDLTDAEVDKVVKELESSDLDYDEDAAYEAAMESQREAREDR